MPQSFHTCAGEPIYFTMDWGDSLYPCVMGDTFKVKRVRYVIDTHCLFNNNCQYSVGDTGTTSTMILRDTGVFNLALEVIGKGDTPSRRLAIIQQYIHIDPCPPTAYYTQDHDTICQGECIQYKDSSTYLVDSWHWQLAGASTTSYRGHSPPEICYPTAGQYTSTLRVHSPYGIDSMQHSIYVRPCHDCIALPNAFTPNGDHINDVYLAGIACTVASYTMRIYNRWGELVYEGHSLSSGWDGTYQGEPQPAGLYKCYVTATHHDETVEQHHSFLTLIR